MSATWWNFSNLSLSITIYNCNPECSWWCKKKTADSHDGVLTMVLLHEKEYNLQTHSLVSNLGRPLCKTFKKMNNICLKNHNFRTHHVSSCSFFLSCKVTNTIENKIMTKVFAGLLICLPRLTIQCTLMSATNRMLALAQLSLQKISYHVLKRIRLHLLCCLSAF